MAEIFRNDVLIVAFLAWLLAQASKLLVILLRERKVLLRALTSAGGMPSSHSAVVVALAMRGAPDEGGDLPLFALAVVFACVVLFNAAGIRRAGRVSGRNPERGV